ncbi:hypothetical protein Tco_0906634 [Tanacetum coccineum]|uniref:Xylulose kinase-1 n=1 Tax=Tanacetum coccineum TaxID=301880 RepID=A0ABQ5CI56_9ASTR
MTTLQFADTHNLVVFLDKSAESEGFEQVVDFLNAHTIKYALTVNPTIYTLCIEQFWATVKVKTVNREQQLQALVEGKKIVDTKASVRRDLQLDDEEDEAVNEEPIMQLKELMDFCTKLQQRVLDLENTKTAQAKEITSLKKRVKKLEKKGGSRTHKLKRLYKITLVNETQGRYRDEDMFGVNDLDGDEVVVEISAATITNVELTLAQTLAELKSTRPKIKGVVMQKPSESTPTISLQLPSHVKGQGSKVKGKAKVIDPEKPLKKKDQIKFDEKEAFRLQAKFDEEDRLAKEKAELVEEANIAWDDIQAKIDANYQLAKRLQVQEQQELTIEEKSTLFQKLLEKRRKFFATKRAEEKRNRPPTGSQQRSIMCTYLKNMAGWKPKDLKNKSFTNIQEVFDQAFKRVNTFVDFRTKLVEGT